MVAALPAGIESAIRGAAFFAYPANYMIDLGHAIIVDVGPTTAIRQAEVTRRQADD